MTCNTIGCFELITFHSLESFVETVPLIYLDTLNANKRSLWNIGENIQQNNSQWFCMCVCVFVVMFCYQCTHEWLILLGRSLKLWIHISKWFYLSFARELIMFSNAILFIINIFHKIGNCFTREASFYM